jgi:hypothetical protein
MAILRIVVVELSFSVRTRLRLQSGLTQTSFNKCRNHTPEAGWQ